MPIFKYICEDCGKDTEIVEANTGRIPARQCRHCGCRRLKKAPSAFVYHKEVTLQDMGVKVIPQAPAPPMPGGGGAVPQHVMDTTPQPPPGWKPEDGCPIHGCSGGDGSCDD